MPPPQKKSKTNEKLWISDNVTVTTTVNGTRVLFYERGWKLFLPQFRQVIMFPACSNVYRLLPNSFQFQGNSNIIGADPGFFQEGGGGVASIKQQYAINFVVEK